MAEVHINEMQSTVNAVDGDAISPQKMQEIIDRVMQVVEERERHRDRVHAEQQTSGGARND